MGNERFLFNISVKATILESLIHFLLPGLIVVREGHVEVASAILLRLLGCRWLDLIGLESAVAESIALCRWHLDLTVRRAAAVVDLVVLLPVERVVFISEGSFFPRIHGLLVG